MGEAKRRAKEIAEGKFKGRCKDKRNPRFENTIHRVATPDEVSRARLTRAGLFPLVNPDREIK